MHIEILSEKYEAQYEDFLLKDSLTLFYVSNNYRRLLKEFLNEEDCYFIALNKWDEVIGVLPAFLKRNEKSGNVLNSLPLYGSNGSIIEYEKNETVKKELLQAFFNYARNHHCISATLITSPFDTNKTFYDTNYCATFNDERVGQLTALPSKYSDLANDLMRLFHQKTRNMIRKAQKSGLAITDEPASNYMQFLSEIHVENINTIGGISKPWPFFELIPQIFEYEEDYKIFVALNDGMPIAALLLFYFNKTVEYFTPVIVQEYRALQPLSLLIFNAMQEAVARGYEWWNWGGTWLTQDGVYRFKKRWGTTDMPYFYYTRVFDNQILHCSKEELTWQYPYFYVLPFSQLSNEGNNDEL
ncbi:MAG: peptidoglycan bridge formation glycyltransferase FemA/FemB family protein [Deltaproteobacteria bacterium]|nr:peptidoglycan bridge formation glycyltransferase FemA/FemB family protein [Deltaproteobacteria bacterium]